MWLNAVDNVGVCHEEVGDPLVPHEHPPTVAAAHHPVLTPKVGLLDHSSSVSVAFVDHKWLFKAAVILLSRSPFVILF